MIYVELINNIDIQVIFLLYLIYVRQYIGGQYSFSTHIWKYMMVIIFLFNSLKFPKLGLPMTIWTKIEGVIQSRVSSQIKFFIHHAQNVQNFYSKFNLIHCFTMCFDQNRWKNIDCAILNKLNTKNAFTKLLIHI